MDLIHIRVYRHRIRYILDLKFEVLELRVLLVAALGGIEPLPGLLEPGPWYQRFNEFGQALQLILWQQRVRSACVDDHLVGEDSWNFDTTKSDFVKGNCPVVV